MAPKRNARIGKKLTYSLKLFQAKLLHCLLYFCHIVLKKGLILPLTVCIGIVCIANLLTKLKQCARRPSQSVYDYGGLEAEVLSW